VRCENLLPESIISSLYVLSGSFFIIAITVFYYFRDKVDDQMSRRTKELFSRQPNDELIEEMKEGKVPPTVVRDFVLDVIKISNPRRRLGTLHLLLPLAACLASASASISLLISTRYGFSSEVMTIADYVSGLLVVAIIFLVFCCGFHIAKLMREL
jgi:hypothetical protein